MTDILNHWRVILQAKTNTQWLASDPRLALGEMVLESDTMKVKIGDGIHAYSQLPYWPPVFYPQAPASSEMVIGYHPDTPRLFLGPKIPLPISQTTHVQAPFSIEMVFGNKPDLPPKLFIGPRIPLPISQQYIHIPAPFSMEMVIGNKPDQPPRLHLGVRIPLPISQTTHAQAVFSIEMVAGNKPDRPRIFQAPRIVLPIGELVRVQAPLSIEMVAGSNQKSMVRVPLVRTFALPVQPIQGPFRPIFSQEMWNGYQPDTRRKIFTPPQVGVQISQTTHVSAPFSFEMVIGYHPDTPRLFVTRNKVTLQTRFNIGGVGDV